MKKISISILGSTGSIGKTLFKILKKNKKLFKIQLLTTNTNYKEVIKQAKIFDVNNIIINDKKIYHKIICDRRYDKLNIYNNYKSYKKIFKNKVDYTMSSISGLEGLKPTLEILKYTKNIAIANKESIICGWSFIKKKIKKYNVNFIPVDSEHFSIWFALKNFNISLIKKIYLTASGGPFLSLSHSKLSKVKISDAIKHPNWSMGKKISIDSSTMMNKVFEIIEAKKIFELEYSNLSILIHPKSYIHSIIIFKNGMIKIIAHNTSMSIPIRNSLNEIKNLNLYNSKVSTNLNIEKLNHLKLTEVNTKQFPIVNILNQLPKEDSLFETIIVSANDELVKLYLQGTIKFVQINQILLHFLKSKKNLMYKKIRPKNINEVITLSKDVRLNLHKKYI